MDKGILLWLTVSLYSFHDKILKFLFSLFFSFYSYFFFILLGVQELRVDVKGWVMNGIKLDDVADTQNKFKNKQLDLKTLQRKVQSCDSLGPTDAAAASVLPYFRSSCSNKRSPPQSHNFPI